MNVRGSQTLYTVHPPRLVRGFHLMLHISWLKFDPMYNLKFLGHSMYSSQCYSKR
jgi:hypothetical protein